MRIETRALVLASVVLCLTARGANAEYWFEVGLEPGYDYEIGWTDGVGNRLGEPLFEGSVGEPTTVPRSTTDPSVKDHYVVSRPLDAATGSAATDVHHGTAALADVRGSWAFPQLRDPSGASNLVYAIDLESWESSSFKLGDVHQSVDGLSERLPGYLVVEHPNPEFDFEDAFRVDEVTGERTLDPCCGASLFSGPLEVIGTFTASGESSTKLWLLLVAIVLIAAIAFAALRTRKAG